MYFYNLLVNKYPGITFRYHKFHDGTSGFKKIASWIYLLWLNFCVRVLRIDHLGRVPGFDIYEEKRLPVKKSESSKYFDEFSASLKKSIKNNKIPKPCDSSAISKTKDNVTAFTEILSEYDIISFDIFDTLIYRPLSAPTDVFYLVGQRFDIPDFKNIRIWAEADARQKCKVKNGHYEVTLRDIWENIAMDTGLDLETGIQAEIEIETSLCYANPFMKEVWDKLLSVGKKPIIVSDMYLPVDAIKKILQNSGFNGYDRLYISSEYSKSKADGKLFEVVLNDLCRSKIISNDLPGHHMIHIGDNPHSDVKMPKKYGIDTLHYQNNNKYMLSYRPYDMSSVIGSAYRAIVTNRLYTGHNIYSIDYEYGFIYGGLFVLGYVNFIHEYVHSHDVDTILFLSRDGEVLKEVYDMLYPEDRTCYAYWSRKAATILESIYDKHDYFRRFIYHKVNQNYTLSEILRAMELEDLIRELSDWKNIWDLWILDNYGTNLEQKIENSLKKEYKELKPDDELTDQNGYLLRRFIEGKWDKVQEIYSVRQKAAKKYYEELLHGHKTAVAVDIGWAGSGAICLSHLVEKEWNIPCRITGIVAGTNTLYNSEPDATESFFRDGRMVSYLYSQQFNRDLLKKHDPNKDYNVFWELLLSSTTPQFVGFGIDENDNISLCFGKCDKNPEGIQEIRCGILDFIKDYTERFENFPDLLNISGRDAYQPMLVAASYDEKYLKMIENRYQLEINVN